MNSKKLAMSVRRKMKGEKSGNERNEPHVDMNEPVNEDEHNANIFPSEDNHLQPDAMSVAKQIMLRRQVDKEKHNQSLQNYAKGGNVQSDGPMMGTNEDGDEDYDGIHSNSDQMNDDMVSYDDKPSLHDKSVMDNQEFDSEYMEDRKFAKGGMIKKRLKKLLG